MTPSETAGASHENVPNAEFPNIKLSVWNDDDTHNHTVIIRNMYVGKINHDKNKYKLSIILGHIYSVSSVIVRKDFWCIGTVTASTQCDFLLTKPWCYDVQKSRKNASCSKDQVTFKWTAVGIDYFLRQKLWLDAPPRTSGVASRSAKMKTRPHEYVVAHSTTICKLVDLIPALHQSDGWIPN